eukprot:CFRG7433T1
MQARKVKRDGCRVSHKLVYNIVWRREKEHMRKKKNKHSQETGDEREEVSKVSICPPVETGSIWRTQVNLLDGESQTKVNTKQKNHMSKMENVTSYPRNQKVLMVRDGDFGFSAGLVSHRMDKALWKQNHSSKLVSLLVVKLLQRTLPTSRFLRTPQLNQDETNWIDYDTGDIMIAIRCRTGLK